MATFDLSITKTCNICVTIEAESKEEALANYSDNEVDGEYADEWNIAEIYCDTDIQIEERKDE